MWHRCLLKQVYRNHPLRIQSKILENQTPEGLILNNDLQAEQFNYWQGQKFALWLQHMHFHSSDNIIRHAGSMLQSIPSMLQSIPSMLPSIPSAQQVKELILKNYLSIFFITFSSLNPIVGANSSTTFCYRNRNIQIKASMMEGGRLSFIWPPLFHQCV